MSAAKSRLLHDSEPSPVRSLHVLIVDLLLSYCVRGRITQAIVAIIVTAAIVLLGERWRTGRVR
jgi:hypothetical protein